MKRLGAKCRVKTMASMGGRLVLFPVDNYSTTVHLFLVQLKLRITTIHVITPIIPSSLIRKLSAAILPE